VRIPGGGDNYDAAGHGICDGGVQGLVLVAVQ
jgi:hypothetical protein